jgi:ComF family protein
MAAARACGVYRGALEASVLFLKSHPHIHTRLYGLMRSLFSDNRALLACDLIVPVPLHPSRLRQRGFNQADVVARLLGRISGIDVDYHSIERIKQTKRHRIGMDAKERAKSVQGAFRVLRPDSIGGRSVLVCDDVMTSGSTIAEAAKSLIKSGASRVVAFTIARALIRHQ